MKKTTLSLWMLGLAGLAQSAGAQRTVAEEGLPRPLPPVVTSAVDPPGALPQGPGAGVAREVRDAGPVTVLQAVLDDAIPLPQRAVGAPGPGRDQVLEEAGGDAYFLGFAAGKYFPPAGERVDAALVAQSKASYTDGRPTQDTYAFVMFERRMTPERLAELEALGARALGFHPHYTQKVALPVTAIDQVAAHPAVRWIGVPRAWQKVHPDLGEHLAGAAPSAPLEVYVSVFESDLNEASATVTFGQAVETDSSGVQVVKETPASLPRYVISHGWQQRALEAVGLEVLEYVDSIRAFRALLDPVILDSVTALDFVQFVERFAVPTLGHEESVPMLLSDYSRQYYDGSTNLAAIVGEVDSGIDITHTDLGIDGVGWNFTSATGVWTDGCEHGSHVAGTILGRGYGNAQYRGNAPGLGSWGGAGRVFAAKIFDSSCSYDAGSLASIVDVMNDDYFDGVSTTPKPHVINNSWGSTPTSGGWIGSEADCRLLDDEVYNNGQMWTFLTHNWGPGASTVCQQGSAKNVFSVGSVVDYYDPAVGDPGSLWTSSARGPCGDNRWKPNVVAPGRWVTSVDANSGSGYQTMSGTSMATPHVVGILAQMMDHHSWMRYAPHRAASMAMATALTKDDQILTYASDSHLDTYGAGRIESYRTHWGSSDFGWNNWGFDLSGSGWTYSDVTVGADATRLIVCMTYHEPACSAGASQALVNDYDMYLDFEPFDPAGNAGEYFVQQSSVDNTEIRIINNPSEGVWRWKVWPESVTGGARVSITASVIYGDTTPDGSLTVSTADTYIQPNEDVDISASAYNPSYVASAVYLDSSSTGDLLQVSEVTLMDSTVCNLMGNEYGGRDLLLGDFVNGWSREARWRTRWPTEGWQLWTVNARSDNWVDRTASVWIAVDGTEPGVVTSLFSSTHSPGVWSNDAFITFHWDPAPDNLSGIEGYGEYMSLGGPGGPSYTLDFGAETNYSTTLSTSSSPWYWNLRAVDRSGNWSSTYASTGGYYIDLDAPVGPSAMVSTTHDVSVLSCQGTVGIKWAAATDEHSGLGGYIGMWDHSPFTNPTAPNNIGAGTTFTSKYLGNGTWYFHLRPRDNVGNLGSTAHSGPFLIDESPALSYCTAKVNSQGCTPKAFPVGTPSMSGGSFQVVATNVLNNKVGLLFWGLGPAANPFQGGIKCVANPTRRTALQGSGGNPPPDDCSGSYSYTWTQAYMLSKGLSVGDTVYAQFWSRDPAKPSHTGLTDAVQFTICQ